MEDGGASVYPPSSILYPLSSVLYSLSSSRPGIEPRFHIVASRHIAMHFPLGDNRRVECEKTFRQTPA
jgi:hypothetical protein